MDEKLKTTIQKIQLLAAQKPEFAQEMRVIFGGNSNDYVLTDDIKAIREALEIRAMPSITFNFINEQRIKDQLIIDNLRMENSALNLKLSEQDRFSLFCVNAFYQLENLLNFYYHITISDINTILMEIENFTANDKTIDKDYSFKRRGNENSITDVPMYHKINAFCNKFYPNDNKLKYNLNNIRKVRNDAEHRSDVFSDQEIRLNEYFNINAVRIYLKQVVSAVKENLTNKTNFQDKTNTDNNIWKTAIIKTQLPSTCFVEIDGKSYQVANKIYGKFKSKKCGDKIQVLLMNKKVVDVK